MDPKTATSEAPKRFRASVSRGAKHKVDPEGGMFGKGVIRDVSVITRGEALGHELWCDSVFLEQVVTELNASPAGIKARFTHPGLSSDGVGSKLGKFTNGRVVGDQVIADMHFQEAAYKTPDGNLAEYVMSLAEDTPEDFGLSIVFDMDFEAADEHQRNTFVNGHSPDKDNKENYQHARLSRLYACDAVDSPAANPNGLFKRGQEAAIEAEAFLEYALGLSGSKPGKNLFSVDGDRAKQFVDRFLASHKLSLIKDDESMGNDVPKTEPVADRAAFAAELNLYVSKFGAENGAKWFTEGVSFADAQGRMLDSLQAQLSAANEKITDLEKKLAAVAVVGEDKGPEFNSGSDTKKERKGRIKITGKQYPS